MIIPFYSEYYFLKEKTKTEKRYWPNPKKLIYPFSIISSANSKKLKVIDPITEAVLYDSGKVMERKIMDRYNTDQEFHHWFDKAVEISIDQRIRQALFRDTSGVIEIGQTNPNSDPDESDGTDESIASAFDNIDVGETQDGVIDSAYEQEVIGEAPTASDVQETIEQPVVGTPVDLGSEAPQGEIPPVDDDDEVVEGEEHNPFLVPDESAT